VLSCREKWSGHANSRSRKDFGRSHGGDLHHHSKNRTSSRLLENIYRVSASRKAKLGRSKSSRIDYNVTMHSELDEATGNPYETPANSAQAHHRPNRRKWYVAAMVAGGIGAICSLYRASLAVWLNAHPQYDDDYWAQQFYIASVAFLISLVVAIGGAVSAATRQKVA